MQQITHALSTSDNQRAYHTPTCMQGMTFTSNGRRLWMLDLQRPFLAGNKRKVEKAREEIESTTSSSILLVADVIGHVLAPPSSIASNPSSILLHCWDPERIRVIHFHVIQEHCRFDGAKAEISPRAYGAHMEGVISPQSAEPRFCLSSSSRKAKLSLVAQEGME